MENVKGNGYGTICVPRALFLENRERLCKRLREIKDVPKSALIVLQGGKTKQFYDTSDCYAFRQEPYFYWAFGVDEPGCYGIIQVRTALTILFVPQRSVNDVVKFGPPLTLEEYKTMYSINEVYYVDDILTIISQFQPLLLLTLSGINTGSGLEAEFPGKHKFKVNYTILHPEIASCRVIKSSYEIEILRYVNRVASHAHVQVMRRTGPGLKEYQCEAMFLQHIFYLGGCRHTPYVCNCSSGKRGAVLEYGHAGAPNSEVIESGEMCLFDMGASYCGYASRIACAYPANGKFKEDQAHIYKAVLKANRTAMNAIKPGVSWVDMHILANRTLLFELRLRGLIKGSLDNVMAAGIAAVFQPHGLGHLLGLDKHDVGGYLPNTPPRPTEPGVNKLRTARVLEAGMVLTVGPGCYFIEGLLAAALADPVQSKFLVPHVMKRFRDFGGVRIVDTVLVTEKGVENFTQVPRTIDEIENVMSTFPFMVPTACQYTPPVRNLSEAKKNYPSHFYVDNSD